MSGYGWHQEGRHRASHGQRAHHGALHRVSSGSGLFRIGLLGRPILFREANDLSVPCGDGALSNTDGSQPTISLQRQGLYLGAGQHRVAGSKDKKKRKKGAYPNKTLARTPQSKEYSRCPAGSTGTPGTDLFLRRRRGYQSVSAMTARLSTERHGVHVEPSSKTPGDHFDLVDLANGTGQWQNMQEVLRRSDVGCGGRIRM